MSIEKDLSAIANALTLIANHLTNAPVAAPAPVVAAPAIPTPAIPPIPAPTVAAPITTAAPALPPLPASPSSAAPFTDSKGMIAYVMAAYQALGAEKGAKIQGVLAGMGVTNINEVKPEQFAALFAGVEALK